MNDLEHATIQAFFLPSKRERYLTLFGKPKRRAQSRDGLNHLRHLDRRFTTPIASSSDVASVLRSHGAPATCRMISADPDLDGKDMPLGEAIDEVESRLQGTIICCIPGQLAYYYGESGEERLLLRR